jgi:hypothetical protein
MDKIDWLAMWCVTFKHNFGYVMIPKNLNVPISNYTDNHPDTFYTGTNKGSETNEPKLMPRSGFEEGVSESNNATPLLALGVSILITSIMLALIK